MRTKPKLPRGAKRRVGNLSLAREYKRSFLHPSNSQTPIFRFVTIVVVPILHSNSMLVQVLLRKGAKGLSPSELSQLQHLENRVIIPRSSAASYVRNLAIRADVACKCMKENVLGFDNWSERLLQIRRLRRLAVGAGGGGA